MGAAPLLALAFGAVPLLVGWITPLQDWPSHLARVHILHQLATDPFWQRYYDAPGFFVPNAMLDVVLLGLQKLGLGIVPAARVFLLATYGVFVAGFHGLSRACGARSRLTLPLAVLLFYCGPLFWGLINYVFGLGLMLGLLGAWMARERVASRLGLAVGGAVALFFCHLVPAFLFAGILGCLELHQVATAPPGARLRRLVRCTSPVALAAVVALLLLSPAGQDSLGVAYAGAGSPAEFLRWKAGIFVKALLGGALASDLAVAGLGAGFALALLLTCRVRMQARIAFVITALVGLTLAAPQRVGAGSLFDYRMAIVPLIVAAASLRFLPRHAGGLRWPVAALTLLVAIRSAALSIAWLQQDGLITGLDRALAALPRGSVLFAGFGRPKEAISWAEWWGPAISNGGALAALHGVFVPSVFAYATQQPLSLKPAWRAWNQAGDFSTPERLALAAEQARAACHDGSNGGAALLVLYPAAFVQQPRFGSVAPGSTDRYALLRAC